MTGASDRGRVAVQLQIPVDSDEFSCIKQIVSVVVFLRGNLACSHMTAEGAFRDGYDFDSFA